MSYVAVRVPLRLSRRKDRCAVWARQGEQRQAFNRGVGLCLEKLGAGERIPSKFDVHKQLTADRESGVMPRDVPVKLQRAGLEAGREAVAKWSKARWRLDQQVVYWAVRLAAAERRAAGDAAGAKLLLKAVNNKASIKPDQKREHEYCVARLAKAEQRRDSHVAAGTSRLFRSRKAHERSCSASAALVFNEGVLLGSDGTVRFPGGMTLRLADPQWRPAEGHQWSGAVHLVDVTSKITSRTRPEHRKYVLHALLRRTDPTPPDAPQSRDEVIGVDAGVVNHIAVSDGRFMNLPAEDDINGRIKELQQARARCGHGSRRWNRLSRQLRKLYAKRTDRRDNGSRQIAAAVADTAGVTVVGAEITNTKQMMSSAAGTAAHPGRNVAAKRSLNRGLSNARFGGIRKDIQRACVKRGKLYVGVPAADTSKICHRCGTVVARESQSSYHCRDCGIVGHADTNASLNVGELAWLKTTQAMSGVEGFDVVREPKRRETAPASTAAKILTNKSSG